VAEVIDIETHLDLTREDLMGIADWSALAVEQGFNQQRLAEAKSAQVKDLDEIRRLLYMALVVNRTKRYNLAGTLINAMLHHEGDVERDRDDMIERVVAAINGEADSAWVFSEIDRITAKLNADD
jgi:hypothetical protein